jgi:hypothetical protein
MKHINVKSDLSREKLYIPAACNVGDLDFQCDTVDFLYLCHGMAINVKLAVPARKILAHPGTPMLPCYATKNY